MTAKQWDRFLSAYYDTGNENETTKAALLPQELQDTENPDKNNFTAKEKNSFAQHFSAHVSQQLILFACFFTVVCFSGDTLLPYLSVFYRQLGFSAKEIGIIGSVQSFVGIFYTWLMGYIADKFAIRRFILVSSLVLHGGARMAIYYVPKIRMNECIVVCNNISYKSVDGEFENCSTASDELNVASNSLYNPHDLHIVFIYLVVINAIAQAVGGPWHPIADGCLLAALGPKRRDEYGYFKGVAGIGRCFGILIGGIALGITTYTFSYCNVDVEKAQFFVVFFLNASLLVVASPLGWWMSNVPDDKKSKSKTSYSVSTLTRDLCRLRYCSAIMVITWLSIVCGKMRTFDFWYIKVLGGTYTMMGWGGFICKAMFTFTLFCLPYLNKKCGHIPMLIVACLGVGAGCIIASETTNVVWMMIPLITREMTFAIYSQAQGAYLGNAVGDQYQATLQSIMASLTFGVGRGVGSILGGDLIDALSPAMSYYIFAAGSFMMAIFLTVVQVFLKITEPE